MTTYNKGNTEVSLPQNSSGTIVIGEVDNSTAGLAAGVTYTFATGLKGVTIKPFAAAAGIDAGTPASTVTHMRVAFNNTAFNDVAVAGLRFLVPMNEEFTISFDQVPLPTQMTIGTATGAATTVEGTAGESFTHYIAVVK